ncbi:MAG: amino acid permease [Bacteroidetes bacterium]|nr:amino acid permease [Bacteroidota bacterium]
MSGQLKEKLGMFSAIMVVISAMIGSGVFKKISVMSNELHSSTMVLLAWGAAGLITLMGSISNAEVAGMIAKPGGQYVYFQKMYGKLFAFLFGWASFSVIQTATAASVAYVFAESVNNLIPLPVLPEDWSNIVVFSVNNFQLMPFHNFGVKALAVGLVILLSVINYFGIDYGERIGNILGGTVVVGILAVILIGFLSKGHTEITEQTSAVSDKSISIASFFAAMMAAFWAFEGWNNVGFLGGEIKNPKRNIPIALSVGTIIVMTLYILANAAFLQMGSIPFFEQLATEQNKIAAVEAMNQVWQYGGLFISCLILVSTFNSTNNSLMTAPRIYYSMANDGLFIKSAGKSHHKYLTPHRSIIYQMIWCSMLVISGSFDMLTEMLVFIAFIFYGCGAFGVIVLRKKMPDEPRPFKVPLYPVIPLVFTVFSAFLVYYSISESPGNAKVGLFLLSLGLPLYYYFKKQGLLKD